MKRAPARSESPAIRRRVWDVLSWAAVLAPFLLYAALLPRFGELQRNDYWGNFQQVIDGDRLKPEPLAWLGAKSNEHRITLPLMAWAANIALSGGDNRVLSALSLALLLGTFMVLYRTLPATVRASPVGRAAFGLLLAALLATPVAAHCWVMGFSGNQWYLANFSAALALVLLARLADGESTRALLAVLGAGLLGVGAHSTHLALWPALILGAALLPTRRRTLALLAVAAVAIGVLFWAGYTLPHGHPRPSSDVSALLQFTLTYLGMLASAEVATARLWGGAGLLLFAAAAWLALRRPRTELPGLLPWLLLALYGLLNAVGTSIGRAGLGIDLAFSSRYASLPSLFWAGTLTALGLLAWGAPSRLWRRAGLGLLGVVALSLLTSMGGVGAEELRRQLQTVRRQPLAALAMRWQVADFRTLRTVSTSPEQLDWSRAFLLRVGHVPYDRIADWPLGERWSGGAIVGADTPSIGSWERTERLRGGFWRVRGRLAQAPGDGSRILLLDQEGVVRGGGVPVPPAGAPPAALFPAPARPALWFGYLTADCTREISAFVELSGDPRLHSLAIDRRQHLDRSTLCP